MSVALYAAELAADPLHAGRRRERQLVLAIAASLVVHVLAVVVLPGLRRADVEPPRPLEVTLLPPVPVPPKPEPPPRIKPPPPPPVTRAPLPKPQPRPAPPQPAATPSLPVLALPEQAAPAAPSFTVPKAPEAPPAPDAKLAAPAPVAAPSGPAKDVAVTPPVYNAAYLGNPPLRYPRIAQKAGIEGTALVRVLVSKEGRPAKVSIEKSSGSTVLDEAALELARAYKFVPARRGQEPVEQSITMPFVYRLDGPS